MKEVRIILLAALAALLLGATAAAAGPDYLVLTPNFEQWFRPDGAKNVDLRLHTVNTGYFNGWVVQRREILLDGAPVWNQAMLFSRDTEGNILYHGDPDGFVLEQPVTWVDAPLAVGKTWTGSRPLDAKTTVPPQLVHYVFAVLEEKTITCPMGTYPCHRVFVATVYPDGSSDGCNFWYNPECGLIRCAMDGQETFVLHKAQLIGDEPPDVDPEDPPLERDLSGLKFVPNPFNPDTEIHFALDRELPVTVEIYDIAGRLVRRLVQAEVRAQGPQLVPWDGRDDAGRAAASGTYVARIRAGSVTAARTMVLVR